jgi:hypothetical protein
MKKCWANILGDCGGKISGEHIVSECSFFRRDEHGKDIVPDDVMISGLSWCKKPMRIKLSEFKSKMLCTQHNWSLSPVDAESKKFYKNILDCLDLQDVRSKMKKVFSWNVQVFKNKGTLLERWFLKTTLNLAWVNKEFYLLNNSTDLVQIAFGRKKFKEKEGLYWVVPQNQILPFEGETKIVFLYRTLNIGGIEGNRSIVGSLFVFKSIPILLLLDSFDLLPEMIKTDCGIVYKKDLRRIRGYDFPIQNKVSHKLVIEW